MNKFLTILLISTSNLILFNATAMLLKTSAQLLTKQLIYQHNYSAVSYSTFRKKLGARSRPQNNINEAEKNRYKQILIESLREQLKQQNTALPHQNLPQNISIAHCVKKPVCICQQKKLSPHNCIHKRAMQQAVSEIKQELSQPQNKEGQSLLRTLTEGISFGFGAGIAQAAASKLFQSAFGSNSHDHSTPIISPSNQPISTNSDKQDSNENSNAPYDQDTDENDTTMIEDSWESSDTSDSWSDSSDSYDSSGD